jgi:glycosyltransferase involved in cell wall biosynthesis
MRVGFEAKRFFTNFTGLGNYSRFVVNALSEFSPENTYTLYSPRIRSHPEYDSLLSRKNIHVVGPEGVYKVLPALWRSYGMSKLTTVTDLDVFHGLSQELPMGLPSKVRKIVTVHDLIFLRYPQFYNPVDVAIYKAKVKSACRLADRVIAISEQTADDLVWFLQTDRKKVSVVYQGCHPSFKRDVAQDEKEAVRKKYGLPENFILNVGTIEDRKNVALLVKALSLLPSRLLRKVVIVGRATKYKDTVLKAATEHGVAEHVLFLHNVSFVDLPAIYQMAEVFVYPSKFEGFGIPLIEAIESKVPVISSTGSCFREAAGPGSLYADPSDGAALAQHLESVLTNGILRNEMIRASSAFIQKFEPQVIAHDLIRAYTTD